MMLSKSSTQDSGAATQPFQTPAVAESVAAAGAQIDLSLHTLSSQPEQSVAPGSAVNSIVEPLKGKGEYSPTARPAAGKLLGEIVSAFEHGDYLAGVGRAALGALPLGLVGAGVAIEVAGIAAVGLGAVSIIEPGAAVLALGIPAGGLATWAGGMIGQFADFVCHDVRRIFGNTDVSWEEGFKGKQVGGGSFVGRFWGNGLHVLN